MPWSFVTYIERILQQLKNRGYDLETSVGELRREMMRTTGVTNSTKLAAYARVMEELGYIKFKGEHVVEICLGFSRPYEFPSDYKKLDVKVEPEVVESGAIGNIKSAEVLHPKDGDRKIDFKKPGEKEKLEEIARLKGQNKD